MQNNLSSPPLSILSLGLCPYEQIWSLQKDLQRALIENTGQNTLIICEHPPVITLGRSTNEENILLSRGELKKQGIEIYEIERGGDVTFHGPGQLVAYPIINLSEKKRDVGWYMRTLEEVIICTLKGLNVDGFRISGKTGVWTTNSDHDTNHVAKKIASIGVRISRWCTLHGFSLNVGEESTFGFDLIHPCGLKGVETTSVEKVLGSHIDRDAFKSALIQNFTNIFDYKDVVYGTNRRGTNGNDNLLAASSIS